MSIELGINITESSKALTTKVLREIRRQLKFTLNKIPPIIKPKIVNVVSNAIKQSPEYQSLVNGGSTSTGISLKGHLGLRDSAQRMDAILELWANSLVVEVPPIKLTARTLEARMNIRMIKANYEDVLKDSSAILVTEKGETLPWLEWLLVHGDKIIIRDYSITPILNERMGKASRTGEAIMRKKGRWGIPSEMAGTVSNNFVTRALKGIENEIADIVSKEVIRHF